MWYTFYADKAKTYFIQWNSSAYGDQTKSASITVTGFSETWETLFAVTTNGWTSPPLIKNIEGTVWLMVTTSSSTGSGSYAIRYFDPTTLPPQIPVTVTALSTPLNKAIISWSAVADADSYAVYRSSEPDTGYTKIADINGVTTSSIAYTDTVTSPANLYYKVSATNINGEGVFSQSHLVEFPDAYPLTEIYKDVSLDGEISGTENDWFVFSPSSQAATIEIKHDNRSEGSGSKTAYTTIAVFNEAATQIITTRSYAWTTPISTPNTGSKIYIKVSPNYSSSTGTYGLLITEK
jgi:fibronectin type 3 domain-containing protein